MLARRVIACLDVADGRVVKGVRFRGHRDVGGIVELAARYARSGVDELVLYDIAASPQGRLVDTSWIARVSEEVSVPLCVAGGIRSVAQAREVLIAGADKVSVNTPALERPALVAELAGEFGSQCVVVGMDSRRDALGEFVLHTHTGVAAATRQLRRRTLDWVTAVQDAGAGEIVVNCMSHDGTGTGYDMEQLTLIRGMCDVPLVASGGARTAEHVVSVFAEADVDAALVASAFHDGLVTPAEVKQAMVRARIPTREAMVGA